MRLQRNNFYCHYYLLFLYTTLATLLFLSSCGYKSTEIVVESQHSAQISEAGGKSEQQPNSLNFQTIKAQVFQNYCWNCHTSSSGDADGVNLETYSAVQSNLTRIRNAVNGTGPKPMPLGGSLSAEDLQLIITWIEAGAPE